MAAWINAFFPTFALIGLGLLLKARLLTDQTVWAGLDRLTFFVLLPVLLASSISTVKLAELPLGAMASAIWLTLAAATLSALILSRLLGHNRAAMTSIVQGGIRFNNFVALGIAAGLFGDAGLSFGGIAAGLIVPVVQTILTLVFVLSDGGRVRPLYLLRQILLNPLLLGCVGGFAFAAAGGMPPGIAPLSRTLGQAALALGLMSVGGGLALSSLREAPLTQVLVGILKLALVPILTLVLARLFGLEPEPAAVAVFIMATPTASTSYVMARLMGGDARLMAATITLQHLASIFTLPLWALFLAR